LKAQSLKDQRFPSILGYLILGNPRWQAGAGFSVHDVTKLAATVTQTLSAA
jgi:hypothetical protein